MTNKEVTYLQLKKDVLESVSKIASRALLPDRSCFCPSDRLDEAAALPLARVVAVIDTRRVPLWKKGSVETDEMIRSYRNPQVIATVTLSYGLDPTKEATKLTKGLRRCNWQDLG